MDPLDLTPDLETTRWFADETRLRSLLRALGTAQLRTTDNEQPPSESALVVSLTDRELNQTRLTFAESAVAGSVRVAVESRDPDGIARSRFTALAPSSTITQLASSGLSTFSADRLAPFTIPEITRIALSAGPNAVTLEKRASAWRVTDPVRAPSETESVRSIIGSILSISAVDPRSPIGSPSDLGLDQPRATIALTSTNGDELIIEIGIGADTSNETVYARATLGDLSRTARIRTESLSTLTAAPVAYLRAIPYPISPPDLRAVTIMGPSGSERLNVTKQDNRWIDESSPITPSTRDAVERLVSILTREPSTPTLDTIGSDQPVLARVQLRTTTNDSPITFTIRVQPIDPDLALLITPEDSPDVVWIARSPESSAVAAWLGAMMSE